MAPLGARLRSAQMMARRAPIRATAIEQRLGTRYTVETLRALIRRYPERRFIWRSEEHTSELQSLMRNSYAVFCLKKKKKTTKTLTRQHTKSTEYDDTTN